MNLFKWLWHDQLCSHTGVYDANIHTIYCTLVEHISFGLHVYINLGSLLDVFLGFCGCSCSVIPLSIQVSFSWTVVLACLFAITQLDLSIIDGAIFYFLLLIDVVIRLRMFP
jgi:hypothetical protein